MLKKITLSFFFISVLIIIMDAQLNNAHTNPSGSPSGRTGSPGDNNVTCNTGSCHSGSAPTSAQEVSITSDVPPEGYITGNTYTINCTATATGITKIGFEVSPQDANGNKMGDFVLPLPSGTKIASPNTNTENKYVTHNSSGTSATGGTKTWTLQWTPPAVGSGTVTFYGAFNFTNSNGHATGDIIKLGTLDINENISNAINEAQAEKPGFTVYPNPTSDALNITFFMYEQGDVQTEVYDINGKLVKSEVTENMLPGRHVFTFNVNGEWPAGIYYLRLHTGQTIHEGKVMVK